MIKKIIPALYVNVSDVQGDISFKIYRDKDRTDEITGDLVTVCEAFEQNGADAIILFCNAGTDEAHDSFIYSVRDITRSIDIPLYVGGTVNRLEDVKKYLYAGAAKAIVKENSFDKLNGDDLLVASIERFGDDKIAIDNENSILVSDNDDVKREVITVEDKKEMDSIMTSELIYGVTGSFLTDVSFDFYKKKEELVKDGIDVNISIPNFTFDDFNVDEKGLIPVIVQDYKTDEVLMMAYMNREAFEKTCSSGKMTYFSRSRQSIWIKGETSGHFQFVKELKIDCDQDTLLAKVKQLGAACHTNNYSCFYRDVLESKDTSTNSLKVFNKIMATIRDRKNNPKEGSYTNYLFDKGIDKILKKCGEEATEIIIAAKNPNPEEIKYEIADFLYHVMVLMELKGVTWEDIIKELDNR